MFASGLIIDFDDTLVATRPARGPLLIDTLNRFGATVRELDLDRHWGMPFSELVSRLAPDVPQKAFTEAYTSAMAAHPPVVHAGAGDLLSLFSERGLPVVVVTSSIRELVLQDLRVAGLLGLINRCWCAEDTEIWKPDPAMLRPVLASLGTAPGELVYVGDDLADRAVAVGNHVAFLAVLTGLHSGDDFAMVGQSHDMMFDSLVDVTNYVSSH